MKKPCPPKLKRESWRKISERLRLKWWCDGEPVPLCGICGKRIEHWNELVVDHILPGKMGRNTKDNSEINLQPAHWLCNLEKGSKRCLHRTQETK